MDDETAERVKHELVKEVVGPFIALSGVNFSWIWKEYKLKCYNLAVTVKIKEEDLVIKSYKLFDHKIFNCNIANPDCIQKAQELIYKRIFSEIKSVKEKRQVALASTLKDVEEIENLKLCQ